MLCDSLNRTVFSLIEACIASIIYSSYFDDVAVHSLFLVLINVNTNKTALARRISAIREGNAVKTICARPAPPFQGHYRRSLPASLRKTIKINAGVECRWGMKQVALLLQRGRAMFPACLVSFSSTTAKAHSLLLWYCSFRFTNA